MGKMQERVDHFMELIKTGRVEEAYDLMFFDHAGPKMRRALMDWAKDTFPGCSYRTVIWLLRSGINSKAEAQRLPDEDLLALPNFGKACLKQIRSD